MSLTASLRPFAEKVLPKLRSRAPTASRRLPQRFDNRTDVAVADRRESSGRGRTMKKDIRLSELEKSAETDSMLADLEGSAEVAEAKPFPPAGSAAVGKVCG
jgi:hypothetical protein